MTPPEQLAAAQSDSRPDGLVLYGPFHLARFITAAPLLDDHDANINIILQSHDRLRNAARDGGNAVGELMKTFRHAPLCEITHVLFGVGGSYRRNIR